MNSMNTWNRIWHQRKSGKSILQNIFLPQGRAKSFWWWARLFSFILFIGSILGVFGFFLLFAVYAKDLPNPDKIVRRDGFSTKIVDRNGNLLYDLFSDQNRVPVTIDKVPKYLQQGTLAIEDKNFYTNNGFDPLTPLRMIKNFFVLGKVTGGSTLTQQLTKNVLLSNERTIIRKFKEFVIATTINRRFTKDQILQMYLNEAPYGGTAWGVGAASQMYFGKDVSQLGLVECAVLAGLPQRPSAYSPYSGKKDTDGTPLWQVRTKGVLRRMREDGYITTELEKQAIDQLSIMTFTRQAIQIKAPHFVFYVKDQLETLLGASYVEKGGLKVTTTLDLPFQDKAQQIVSEEIAKVENLHITNGAAVVMDPNNGEVLAMVGSKDYFAKDYDGQYNVAVDGLRQPGSSIKPVTYLAALRKGFTPVSMIMDTPTSFPGGAGQKDYEPKNYDGKFHGPVSLRVALGSSLNIPAVKVLAQVGVKDMLQLAYDMGFKTLEPTQENMRNFGLSVTLGGGEVHLIDTASAYSSIANGGRRVEPISILKVEDKDGKVVYQNKPVLGKEVLSKEETYMMNEMLTDNNNRLLTFGQNSLLNYGDKAIAVKTGTTNDRKDNWTVGWSKTTLVSVWVGNNDNTQMKSVASGISGASPIWRKIMNEAISLGRKADAWDIPSGISEVKVDAISGYPAHESLPEITVRLVASMLPSLPDPYHKKIKLCRGEGKLATQVDIQRGEYDEKEFITPHDNDPYSTDGRNRWQEGIDAWIATLPADQQSMYRPPTEVCGTKDEVWINMTSPSNEQDYSQTNIDVKVETVSEEDIDHVEIWVNDALKETLKNKPYQTTLNLSAGRYKLFAKSIRKDGKVGQSGDIRIGTGGTHWQEPPPSPSPTPTASQSGTLN